MLLLIPTVTYKILLSIVGNEFLSAFITAITSEVDEDIALRIVLDALRICTSGVSRYIFQLLGPCHW